VTLATPPRVCRSSTSTRRFGRQRRIVARAAKHRRLVALHVYLDETNVGDIVSV
jgi:hypothetical protein